MIMEIQGWDITKCDLCRDPEFEEILSSIHYSMLSPDHQDDEIIEITPLKIVSVVVCAELKDTSMDLLKLSEGLKAQGECIVYQKNRGEKSKLFYNCMVWKIQIRDGEDYLMNLSVKCFPNGKFQYSGFKTMHAIKLVTRIVTSRIRKIEGAMTPPTQLLQIPRIIQINSCFYLLKDKKKHQIKQILLNKLLLEKEHVNKGGRIISSSFMPEKYPGINAKFKASTQESTNKNQVTLLIFATGSVLINGHNDIIQYREAYYMLCNLLHNHKKELITENLLN
tara:strand:- start:6488 stop:7327 length:840 start_codon:yes stop_codon:yes gene_type:complete